jgi:uncharacterized membrane protein YoaK (UPF0700 family)
MALTLTFVAGFVDVVGYLSAYHAFAANMTGNTVHLGQALITGERSVTLLMLGTVTAFLCGSIAGRTVMEAAWRFRLRTVASITLALEAGLILIFLMWTGHAPPAVKGAQDFSGQAWLLLLLAGAMGLQTATITRIGSLTIHTTFVTGMLNKLAQLSSHLLFNLYERAKSSYQARTPGIKGGTHARQAAFVASIWLLYVCGPGGGTWGYFRWGAKALCAPVTLLIISIGLDQVHPLSIEEERDQAER